MKMAFHYPDRDEEGGRKGGRKRERKERERESEEAFLGRRVM